jgi:hypothetical protein
VGATTFAGFDGVSEEPFDGRARMEEEEGPHIAIATFADMNLNGFRDLRETVTQAWRRLGILQPNESFNRDRYVACVQAVVDRLSREGFIAKNTADFYLDQARSGSLPDWVR